MRLGFLWLQCLCEVEIRLVVSCQVALNDFAVHQLLPDFTFNVLLCWFVHTVFNRRLPSSGRRLIQWGRELREVSDLSSQFGVSTRLWLQSLWECDFVSAYLHFALSIHFHSGWQIYTVRTSIFVLSRQVHLRIFNWIIFEVSRLKETHTLLDDGRLTDFSTIRIAAHATQHAYSRSLSLLLVVFYQASCRMFWAK